MNPWSLSVNYVMMAYIIRKDKTKIELAQYPHTAAFSPSLSTFTKEIRNGNFVTWHGIEDLNLNKFIGTTIAIEKKISLLRT